MKAISGKSVYGILSLLLAGLIALLSCSLPVLAHHSQAAFDSSKIIRFEGTVHRLDWKNPHIYLIVETLDEDGKPYLQQIEGLAITQAQVDGLQRDALEEGMYVSVRANPNRHGQGKTVRGLNVTTPDGRILPFYERASANRTLEPASSLAGHWAPTLGETNRMFGEIFGTWKFSQDVGDRAPVAACDIEPVPFLTVINELRVIELADNKVIMHHDNSGDIGVREIALDQDSHPDNIVPSRFGHSIGHWEGDTLVIDTVGYEPHTSGIFSGIASGLRKHTVERLTLEDDGRKLRYDFSMEDPDNLVEPVAITMYWEHRPDLQLSTEPCDTVVSDRWLND